MNWSSWDQTKITEAASHKHFDISINFYEFYKSGQYVCHYFERGDDIDDDFVTFAIGEGTTALDAQKSMINELNRKIKKIQSMIDVLEKEQGEK